MVRSNTQIFVSAKARSKTMQIRLSMTMVPLLATILVSPVVQATGEPSSDARLNATARSSRADLAQLEAPIGHRQPTLDDLPPWLREEEKPGTEASPTQDSQAGSADVEQKGRRNEHRRTPSVRPNDGVPRLGQAADIITQHPVALQLRTLQTMAEIATEKNSTIIFPAQFMTTVQEAIVMLNKDSASE